MSKNITLIGMPSCGKSTVGVILAKVLGMSFCDTDLIIQTETGERLCDLIAERGMDGFLALENDCISRLDLRNTVIATGGSAVFGREAMAHLHESGRVVYLHLPLDEVERRVGDILTRGVVVAPGETIADVYRERQPLYEREADITVESAGRSVEQTVADIVATLAR